MNLYQAGYFRKGRQGSKAGWSIVSPSGGMSYFAKEGFEGIAANLIELKKNDGIPVVNTGVFFHDYLVYFMNVNYEAKGEDDRGTAYVHGYCFEQEDYYELCSKPEMLLGVKEENFPMEYDASVEEYPEKKEFTYQEPDFQELLRKYDLGDEEYKNLIFGAINAVENYSNPLCIKTQRPVNEYRQITMELLYLIMKGLPYHLRSKISFFSYPKSESKIYLSDKTEGNNYFDLDNKVFEIDYTMLKEFHFTQIYNTLGNSHYLVRESCFKTMADVINSTLKNLMHDIGCEEIDSVCLAIIKKNDINPEMMEKLMDAIGFSPEMARKTLVKFLGWNRKESKETFAYFNLLLEIINENSVENVDEITVRKLMDLYENTEIEIDRTEIYKLTANELLKKEKEEAFGLLDGMDSEKFHVVSDEIQKKDPEFYEEYYVESYLPRILTSIFEVKKHLTDRIEKNNKPGDSENRKILNILDLLVKKEMEEAEDFYERIKIRSKVNSILKLFPSKYEQRVNAGKLYLDTCLWEHFQIFDFKTEDISLYYDAGLEQISKKDLKNVKKIKALYVLFEVKEEEKFLNFLNVFFSGKDSSLSEEEKDYIKKLILKERIHLINLDTAGGFDAMLRLYFTRKKGEVSVLPWARKGEEICKDFFDAAYITRMAGESECFKNEEFKKNFCKKIARELKEAEKNKETEISENLIDGLKKYNHILQGKPGKEEAEYAKDLDEDDQNGKEDKEEQENKGVEERKSKGKLSKRFINTMHRLMNSMLIVFVMVVFLTILYRNAETELYIVFLLGGGAVLLWAVDLVLKIMETNDIVQVLKGLGMDTPEKVSVYFGSAVLMLILIVVLAVSGKEMIGLLLFTVMAIAGTIVNSLE